MPSPSLSVLVGLFPFLLFFLWLGALSLRSKGEPLRIAARTVLLVIAGNIVLALCLLYFGLVARPELPPVSEPAPPSESAEPRDSTN